MLQFFRSLRRKFIEGRNLKKYLLYAIGEILLVVIGILLALKVNTINENRISRRTELTIYKTLKDQLRNYQDIIEADLNFNKYFMLQFQYANTIVNNEDRTKLDTLGKIASKLIDYSDFDGQGNIYETMVASGEIKLLNNAGIVEGIRRLEGRMLHINRIENIHYDAVITYVFPFIQPVVKLSTGKVNNPEDLYSIEFQNLLAILLKIMDEKDEAYHTAIGDIEQVVESIDTEELRGQ